jgi:hypothetical protein
VGLNLATLTALVVLLASGVWPRSAFEEITAERINIVTPGGTTVLAISNRERIAPPVVDGKVYPVSVSEGREYMAGMIFFNQDGDEMGGLVFNSFRQANGRIAGVGHLSFDRFADNQVLALEYNENAAGVRSGLALYDRPGNGVFGKSLDLAAAAQTASPERAAAIRQAAEELARDGALGVERAFLGSRNQVAQLVLRDRRGRVRARLLVDETDEAKLEFLGPMGEVLARFPPD